MSAPLKYPQLKYFAPHSSYQMQPVLQGEKVVGAPDFHSQAEAAWGVAAFYRELGLPEPAFADQALQELNKPQHAGRKDSVEARVKEFIAARKLTPVAAPVQAPPQGAAQAQAEPATVTVANPSAPDHRQKTSGRR